MRACFPGGQNSMRLRTSVSRTMRALLAEIAKAKEEDNGVIQKMNNLG